jgi:peptidoglycan/xylan/chitin deacetylase (PgdA/CDA1 family)
MKRIIKKLVQRVFYPLLAFTRWDQLLAARAPNHRLIVFFHGVRKNNSPQINGRHMPVGEFETLIRLLKSRFEIVPLEQICERKNRFAKRTIAITFDDGFTNNLKTALPVLKRLNIPATFFVSTNCLTNADYVHPSDLIDLVKQGGKDIEIAGVRFTIRNNQYVEVQSGRPAYHYLAKLSPSQLAKSLAQLSVNHNLDLLKSKVDEEVYKLVTSDDVEKLRDDSLMSIGSHGHQHVHMTTLDSEDARTQLTLSRQLLDTNATRVNCLAFPYGDFNEQLVTTAIDVGFSFLFAGGHVEPPFSNKVFPRIGVSNTAGPAFNLLSISRGFGRFGF